MDFQNPGFWRLKAPETRIWAPEGAFFEFPSPFQTLFGLIEPYLILFDLILAYLGQIRSKKTKEG